MSNATNYLESALLRHLLRVAAWPQPAGIWAGLLRALPADDGTGGNEVTGGGYARTPVAAFTVSGTTPTEGTNTDQVEFPLATADWGTVTHAALYDAASAGNMLIFAQLVDPDNPATPMPKTITKSDVFRISAGMLRIRLD